MRFSVFAAVILVGVASPAIAAPQKQVTCIYDAFSAEQRSEWSAELLKFVDHPDAAVDEKLAQQADGTVAKAGADCTKRHKWSDNERAAAEDYAAALLMLGRLKGDPLLAGVNMAALDAHLVKVRPGALGGQPTDAEMETFPKALVEAGVRQDDAAAMTRGFTYLSMAMWANSAKAAFVADQAMQ